MKSWPVDAFEIETTFSRDDLVHITDRFIEPKKIFRFSSNHKLFEGEVTQDGFKIMRIIHYRNSFLPVITGTFVPRGSGSAILIHMRLHAFVFAFMSFWFCGIGTGVVASLFAVFTGKASAGAMLAGSIGMFVFGCLLVTLPFWWEAKKARNLLMKSFQNAQ